MATRGTAILLNKDIVLESVEFNGDMYPDGHGDEFFDKLSKVRNTEEFDKFLNDFNDSHFQYEDDFLIYECEDIYSPRGKFFKYINLTRNTTLTSDWIFIKNLTGEIVNIEAMDGVKSKLTQIQPGETLRFNFNKFPQAGTEYRISQ